MKVNIHMYKPYAKVRNHYGNILYAILNGATMPTISIIAR